LLIAVYQVRAGVKEIDLRLGDSFQASIHRAVSFTPMADVGQQLSEECQ
jgi:molecular chaperone GrpE (heat shock protein)